VLLVDANWLQPSLTSDAEVASEPGLADVLRGNTDLDQALIRTARPRLAFLAAGDLSQDRPPLGELPSLIHRALSSFGAIVVDLPPALADESMVLPWAGSLQQLFIVVRSGVTPLALVRRAVDGVAPVRPQVVLNGMRGWTEEQAARPRVAMT
jgi:Mrp family chromosome partitioning ATPase